MSRVATDHRLLLERDRELESIGRLLRRTAEGRGGALVMEGPAGIGKTALLRAAQEAAERQGFRVLRARGAELEREFAFGVVRQLLEPLIAQASDGERSTLLDGPAGVAARLLAIPGADRIGGTALVSPDPSFAVPHGLYWLCANLAAEDPVALVVDDAHWVDAASLRFFVFLLPRLEELRIALLLAARPAEAGQGGELLSTLTIDLATEVLTLRPLTGAGVATLIAAGLGSDPEPGFVTACEEATGGTPFLVRTLVTALAAEGIAPVDASSVRLEGMATATVGRWALLQLRRLGPDAARLAKAVAVLERSDLSEATALSELDPAEAARAAELLVRAGLLEERPLTLAHPILRAGIYGEMAAADRAEMHSRAARVLARGHASAERIAEHLLASVPDDDPWVVEQLRALASTATARGAPESAAAYLRRALAEPPPPEVGARVLLDLGLAELNAGQPGWEDRLTGALVAAGDDTTRTAAAQLLAMAFGSNNRMADAVEICDRAIARLDGSDPAAPSLLESLAVFWGMNHTATAAAMADRTRSLIALARRRSVPRHVVAVAAYQAALANEPAAGAAELARRGLAGVEAGPWFPAAWVALLLTEAYAEVQATLDAALADVRATANALVLPAVLSLRAWLAIRRGDLMAAEADARALLECEGLSPPPLWCLLAMSVLVVALVERGELGAAEVALDPVAGELETTVHIAAQLLHARGRLRLEQRRFDEAVVDFLAAGDIATRIGAPSPTFVPWRSHASLALLSLGETERARRLSSEEVELARAFGAPRALGVALRADALVVGGLRGEPLLREAVEVLGGPDTRLEQARALADLGALLRRSNRRVEAREPLRRALDVAHRAGARPLAAQAQTELRATGAKPRRVVLTGLEALTASERRIAGLAADGLSNRQIAQTLFVTLGTVECHLTNVFSKLCVRSRVDLAQALLQADASP
jgi:DNA-binding CsgD family transcriptional regulator